MASSIGATKDHVRDPSHCIIITALNGSHAEPEGLLTWHIVAPAELTATPLTVTASNVTQFKCRHPMVAVTYK